MRLKEDTTTLRVSSLLKRNFRHDHNEDIMMYRSHKPTNKWCRGKVGVRHAITWHKEDWLLGQTINVGTCDTCGKRMYSEDVELQQS